MKRIDLTDDQLTTLTGILRERLEARGADRAELVAAGASRGLVEMADLAITSLAELHTACLIAVAADHGEESRAATAAVFARLHAEGRNILGDDSEAMRV